MLQGKKEPGCIVSGIAMYKAQFTPKSLFRPSSFLAHDQLNHKQNLCGECFRPYEKKLLIVLILIKTGFISLAAVSNKNICHYKCITAYMPSNSAN